MQTLSLLHPPGAHSRAPAWALAVAFALLLAGGVAFFSIALARFRKTISQMA